MSAVLRQLEPREEALAHLITAAMHIRTARDILQPVNQASFQEVSATYASACDAITSLAARTHRAEPK